MATFSVANEQNKIFLSRDYSHGTACRFNTELPQELRSKVSESQFKSTVTLNQRNAIFRSSSVVSCVT